MKHLQLGIWTVDGILKTESHFGMGSLLDATTKQLTTHWGTTIPGLMKHINMEMNVAEVAVKKWPLNRGILKS